MGIEFIVLHNHLPVELTVEKNVKTESDVHPKTKY